MKTKINKDWFGREKSIEEVHNDSKLWISEIKFINDEIRFLEHLLGYNYIDCIDNGYATKIEIFTKKIADEREIATTLDTLIKKHKKTLSNLILKNSVISNINYLETHRKIELEIEYYFKKYKRLKKQIFELVENVMKKKGQKKLLK